jgi:hypothetical protein
MSANNSKSLPRQLISLLILLPFGIMSGLMLLGLQPNAVPTDAARWAGILAGPLTVAIGMSVWWQGGVFKNRRWIFIPIGAVVYFVAGLIAYQPAPARLISTSGILGLYVLQGLASGAIVWRLALEGYLPFWSRLRYGDSRP